MQMVAVGEKQEQAHISSLDEAHAPFKYTTRGTFDYNGTFSFGSFQLWRCLDIPRPAFITWLQMYHAAILERLDY